MTTASAMLLTGASGADAARIASAKSVCSSVSASSVSAIIGYTVPTPTTIVNDTKATKTNFDTSAVTTSCLYGAETSLASLKKLVLLGTAIESKPITSAEFAKVFKQQQEGHSLGLKIASYSGLGVTALHYTASIGGIFFQGIYGFDGTHVFGASVYSKTLSESKLAALAKLAEKL